MLETPSSLVNSQCFLLTSAPWAPNLPTFVAGEGDGGVGCDFQLTGEAPHIEPSHATTVPGLPHAVLQTVCRGDRREMGDPKFCKGSLELGESGERL
jgi:hypothetical protein